LELQRLAHKGDYSEANNELHQQIQSLLDSDHLWLQGLEVWITMVRDDAAEDINPVRVQLDDDIKPLTAVRGGMASLVIATQRLRQYEKKLWHNLLSSFGTPTCVTCLATRLLNF